MIPWLMVAAYLFLGIVTSIIYNYKDRYMDVVVSCFLGGLWPVVFFFNFFYIVFYKLPKFIAEWIKMTIWKLKLKKGVEDDKRRNQKRN